MRAYEIVAQLETEKRGRLVPAEDEQNAKYLGALIYNIPPSRVTAVLSPIPVSDFACFSEDA